mgnify:CR=1 FL=1
MRLSVTADSKAPGAAAMWPPVSGVFSYASCCQYLFRWRSASLRRRIRLAQAAQYLARHPLCLWKAPGRGEIRLRIEAHLENPLVQRELMQLFHFIPVFDDFGVQGSVQWEDGCLKPPAQQRIGNALYANTFLAIVQYPSYNCPKN